MFIYDETLQTFKEKILSGQCSYVNIHLTNERFCVFPQYILMSLGKMPFFLKLPFLFYKVVVFCYSEKFALKFYFSEGFNITVYM